MLHIFHSFVQGRFAIQISSGMLLDHKKSLKHKKTKGTFWPSKKKPRIGSLKRGYKSTPPPSIWVLLHDKQYYHLQIDKVWDNKCKTVVWEPTVWLSFENLTSWLWLSTKIKELLRGSLITLCERANYWLWEARRKGCANFILSILMSRKGPKVGQGMLDFVEDLRYDVVSH